MPDDPEGRLWLPETLPPEGRCGLLLLPDATEPELLRLLLETPLPEECDGLLWLPEATEPELRWLELPPE